MAREVLGFLPRRVPLSPFGLADLPNSPFVYPGDSTKDGDGVLDRVV